MIFTLSLMLALSGATLAKLYESAVGKYFSEDLYNRASTAEVLRINAADFLPVYNRLLISQLRTEWVCEAILSEIAHLDYLDTSVCHDVVVDLLLYERSTIRQHAALAIATIGYETDTPPLHVLLMDEDDLVRRAAVYAISKIGGKTDLIALDLWLRSGHWHDDKAHKDRVQKMRDDLATRLKKEEDYRNSKPDPADLKAKPPK